MSNAQALIELLLSVVPIVKATLAEQEVGAIAPRPRKDRPGLRRKRDYVVAPILNPRCREVKTVPEFIAYAKANPGKINFASQGTGLASHLMGELFKMMAGVNLVHVPYSGNFLADLLSGQIGSRLSCA
jgi:hypothetical protein